MGRGRAASRPGRAPAWRGFWGAACLGRRGAGGKGKIGEKSPCLGDGSELDRLPEQGRPIGEGGPAHGAGVAGTGSGELNSSGCRFGRVRRRRGAAQRRESNPVGPTGSVGRLVPPQAGAPLRGAIRIPVGPTGPVGPLVPPEAGRRCRGAKSRTSEPLVPTGIRMIPPQAGRRAAAQSYGRASRSSLPGSELSRSRREAARPYRARRRRSRARRPRAARVAAAGSGMTSRTSPGWVVVSTVHPHHSAGRSGMVPSSRPLSVRVPE